MMSRVKMGMVAGFVATIAVSILEIANMMLGPWALPFPRIVAEMAHTDMAAIGWIGHFVAGTLILGPAFGVLCPRLPTDTPETKGIFFAVGAWIVMMLTVAPLAGIGVFGARAGLSGVVWMLATHAVFGIVLGNVYARLVAREKRRARMAPVETVGAH